MLPPDRPALMGIVNVTPDSFSDGGVNFAPDTAIAAGLKMIEEGADFVDVGGESTRPGAEAITAEEELHRIIPVISELAKNGVKVSVDTMKSRVAREAIDAGAVIVNDVTALSDCAMTSLLAETGATVCLMHMQGSPRTMQQNPEYDDVVRDVRDFLLERVQFAEDCGVPRENVWIDPGIGFGKTVQHNLLLLKHMDEFVKTRLPVMIGVSRKSFLGKVLSPTNPLPSDQRLEGTLSAQVVAQLKGAKIIRAHDVKEARRAIDIAAAIAGA
jgi:dihydropteroate synthase